MMTDGDDRMHRGKRSGVEWAKCSTVWKRGKGAVARAGRSLCRHVGACLSPCWRVRVDAGGVSLLELGLQ